MATTTMPPTTHALPHAQRLRLMRSTRKLGALLGETPLLESLPASPTAPFSPSHSRSISTMSTETKRTGRLFMAAQTAPRSSSLSLSATRAASQGTSHGHGHSHLAPSVSRPTLFVRLPPPDSSSPAERTSLPSPLSLSFNLTLNSPSTSTGHGDANRRRKMAKLARTLGENVPPELVFPTTPAPRARRRASTLSVPESVFERRARTESPAPPFTSDEPFSFPSTVPYVSEPEPRASSDTSASAASESSGASRDYLLPPAQHDTGMHRKEQGWSGEWGGRVGNMDDVVRSLRGLKVK